MERDGMIDQVVHRLTFSLQGFLEDKIGYSSSCKSLKLQKKTKDFKSGDITLPRGCVKLNEDEFFEFLKSAQNCNFPAISKITQDNFSLIAIYLDRPTMFRMAIKEVHQKSSTYGHCSQRSDVSVIVMNHCCASKSQDVNKKTSLIQLRCEILQGHLLKLLQLNSYTAISLNQHTKTDHESTQCMDEDKRKRLIQKARACGTSVAERTSVSGALDPDAYCDNVTLDLRKLIAERKLATGKEGYNKNLNMVEMIHDGEISEMLENAIRLEVELVKRTEDQPILCCVHLVPQAQCFKNQQAQLVHDCISDLGIRQSQITVGRVVAKSDGDDLDEVEDLAEEFRKLRFDQLKEASEMRYGDMHDAERERILSVLTTASIAIDVLQNAAHVPLHLDFSEEGAENRIGAFIMYNTARLANLWNNFLHEVEKGSYPPLPGADDIDFSLLREEEEWEILYLYIARYPELISQSVEVLVPTDGKNTAKVHTHKVTNYLISFSKCLSSYYSRYHILGGGEHHLLPLMYARLHLMQASHQVLNNALELIGVKPFDYL